MGMTGSGGEPKASERRYGGDSADCDGSGSEAEGGLDGADDEADEITEASDDEAGADVEAA